MSNRALAEYFNVHITVICRYLRDKIPLQEIHDVLESNISRRKKKDYIYSLRDITLGIRDSLWENWIGDKGFNYNYDGVIMSPFQKIRYDFIHSDRYYLGK